MLPEKYPMESCMKKPECTVSKALSIIGGKWKLVIIFKLYEGIKRFGELKRSIEGIATKTLAQQLKELVRDGLIKREVFSEIPPKVEYSLTEKGHSVKPIFEALSKFGSKSL
jgi:DNA-binding HxlR family transcriptional regulator